MSPGQAPAMEEAGASPWQSKGICRLWSGAETLTPGAPGAPWHNRKAKRAEKSGGEGEVGAWPEVDTDVSQEQNQGKRT